MASPLPCELAAFLKDEAEALDRNDVAADAVVPQLGRSGLLREGVPQALGGAGSALSHGIEAVAAVAERSLAAAFVFWGQRAFIEYVVHADAAALREHRLPALLQGEHAGATGLSNAMKFLPGIEGLGVRARAAAAGGGFLLDGAVPWATNLRSPGFTVAVAVAREGDAGDAQPLVVALPHDRAGVARSADFDLLGLRGTRTAALSLAEVPIGDDDRLARDGRGWLPQRRPAFLGLQCGMSIGLARASLAAARQQAGGAIAVLGAPLEALAEELHSATAELKAGVDDGRFVATPLRLFELRIRLAEIALAAVQLELQASGGRAYHLDQPLGFARRWREAAFVPIVTPSLAQLQGELVKHRARQAAAPAG